MQVPPRFMRLLPNIAMLHSAEYVQINGIIIDMVESHSDPYTATALCIDLTNEQLDWLEARKANSSVANKGFGFRMVDGLPVEEMSKRMLPSCPWDMLRRVKETDGQLTFVEATLVGFS